MVVPVPQLFAVFPSHGAAWGFIDSCADGTVVICKGFLLRKVGSSWVPVVFETRQPAAVMLEQTHQHAEVVWNIVEFLDFYQVLNLQLQPAELDLLHFLCHLVFCEVRSTEGSVSSPKELPELLHFLRQWTRPKQPERLPGAAGSKKERQNLENEPASSQMSTQVRNYIVAVSQWCALLMEECRTSDRSIETILNELSAST